MPPLRWYAAGAAVLLAGAALAAPSAADPACQTARFFSIRAPLFLLATAGADTVHAGPGPIEYNAGNDDPDSLAAIHGQRFRLDRAGGDVPAELAGAAGGEAVLVPYGWECGDTWRWHQARFAEPGAQIFVDAMLRPRAQWVDGRPTFDVEVVHDLYPESYTLRVDSVGDLLSAEDVFGMMETLPLWEAVEADTAAAYQPFLRWAAANPALGARFPATEAMREAQEWLQPCVPRDPHPVAGTYRATVVVEETDTLAMYFRTDAAGYPECPPAEPRLDLTAVHPRPAERVRMLLTGASTPSAIPRPGLHFTGPGARCGGGSVEVGSRAPRDADGRPGWEADYNQLALPHCFADHAGIARAVQATFAAYQAGHRDVPGRFYDAGDGEMRFEQAWRVDGRPVLQIRAARVGPEVNGG